jgi:aspartate kinase
MVVMKFGGTSVGDARRIESVAGIVRTRLRRKPIVVVSAMAGVTDGLISLYNQAVRGKGNGQSLIARHLAAARELGLLRKAIQSELQALVETLGEVRLKRTPSPRDRDLVLSFGERLSARLVAGCLSQWKIPAAPVMTYEAGLVTDGNFGSAEPLPETMGNLRKSLARVKGVPVVTGFLGRTREGAITTLGRGGSDFTAALVGAAVGAEEVEIWTDVNGVLSADPKVVPEAHTIGHLSFSEAAELAYFGAKVLHPKTLWPAMQKDIPVRVLNTHNPGHAGTVVTRRARRSEEVVKAIAWKKGITVVNVVSTRMLLAHGFLAKLFQVFADHRIAVDLLATTEVSVSLTVDDAERLGAAVKELKTFSDVKVKKGRTLICIVGDGLAHSPGVSGKVFGALGRKGTNVEMISQGASKINLSFVVRGEEAEPSVRILHQEFFKRRTR